MPLRGVKGHTTTKEFSSLYKNLQRSAAYKNYYICVDYYCIHSRYNLKLIVNKKQYSFEQNPTNAHICRTLKVIWASLPVIWAML
jgi:hypothetical protein